MKKLDEIAIADLMPDSISSDREVSATARAIDPQLKVISEGVDLPLILASIDTLSAGVLEHLAAQYDLTAWDSAWSIDTKRAVLKTAIADKRKKGTRGAVQRAIEAVAPLATITEWWQKTPKGTPHTFEIDVLQDGEAVDAETVADVIAQVNDSKPVRSHFTFSVGQKAEGDMYLSGVIRTIAYARVRSSGMTAVRTEIDAGVLAALRGMNIRRIMEFSHMGDMPEPTPVPVGRIAGGMIGPDSRTDFTVPIEPYYYTVDNITLHGIAVMGGMFTVDNISLVGMMPPMGGMYAPAAPAEALELVVSLAVPTPQTVSFSSNGYWYSQLLTNDDVQALVNFGGELKSNGSGGYLINASPLFFYEVADVYTGNGTGSIPVADLSNFRCAIGTKGYIGALNIISTNAYNNVMTWKVRITKVPNVAWVKADRSSDWTGYAGSLPLYDASGNAVPFDSTKTYTVLGYYTSANYVDLSVMDTGHNYGLSIINDSGNCKIKWANSTTLLIQRVIYKVE